MLNLGDKVRDRISGFEGIVTGRCEYLFGCIQVVVHPQAVSKDGKRMEAEWFDEDRCELVQARAVKAPASAPARAGGPQRNPPPAR